MPIAFLTFGMFWTNSPGLAGEFTGEHVVDAFTNVNNLALLSNTLLFSFGALALTLSIATLMAWIVQRTNTPGRRIIEILPLMAFMFPSMLGDLAWGFLFGPRAGLINLAIVRTFGLKSGPFDAFTIWGMIWSQGVSLVPVAYLLISASFSTMDPSLEDAARISGANIRNTMFKVTFPLLTPAIASAGALLFMLNIHAFETPIFLGLPGRILVYMNAIYESLVKSVPPRFGLATAQSFIFLLLSGGAMAIYLRLTRRLRAYTVITGKAYRPKVLSLGKWKYLTFGMAVSYVIVAIGLPLTMILLISLVPFYSASLDNPFATLTLKNYESAFRAPIVLGSAFTSVELAVSVAILSIALGSTISYIIVKSKIKGRRMLEGLSALPLAYPSLVFGLALMWMFLTLPVIRGLWGSIWVLVIGYIAIFLPFTIRILTNSMVQIHSELEEAARTSGASWWTSFRRVTVPILKPALLNAAVFVFISAYRQLGAAVLLVNPGTIVFPVAILTFWIEGQVTLLSAAVMVYGATLVAIVMTARFVLKAKIGL